MLSCSPQANPSFVLPWLVFSLQFPNIPFSSVDSCCAETFGGLILATQYWDTYTGFEAEGQLLPPARWTIHGLWPDFCNGSFTQYCDLNRQYDPSPSPNTTNGLKSGTFVPPYNGPDVSTFISAFGKYDLLAYMNKYWVSQGGSSVGFWAHEFSKHATCYSTFDVPCYGPEYVQHEVRQLHPLVPTEKLKKILGRGRFLPDGHQVLHASADLRLVGQGGHQALEHDDIHSE